MSVKTAQEKCATAFGIDTTITGKLFEPTSMEIFKQVNRTAEDIFGAGKEIWTGFKKVEDIEQNGENIIHSSTGEKAKIEPWLGTCVHKISYKLSIERSPRFDIFKAVLASLWCSLLGI